ncbi:hypothetical protein, partial [Salmonella sp. s54395]|uniref:hypothetical protein n=1 Tax=Salmonella sp. s54395 TaxID=3159664 RepID=UPI0039817703
ELRLTSTSANVRTFHSTRMHCHPFPNEAADISAISEENETSDARFFTHISRNEEISFKFGPSISVLIFLICCSLNLEDCQ